MGSCLSAKQTPDKYPTLENIQSLLIPGLPNDISLQCISRVQLEDHQSLPLVSKSWMQTFSNGKLYQLREALRISESYHIFSFVKFVGYHAERYSGGDYKSFLDFKIFNPKTSELLPFSIFQLQHSDGKPLKYDGVNIELTTFTLGSDIYIIPLRRSDEFWVFRGKSQKLELMNFPNEESWSTHFTYSLHKKLIFGSFTSLSDDGILCFRVDLKILGQNGEWISKSTDSPTLSNFRLRFPFINVGVQDGNLYFKCERKLTSGWRDCHMMFDLENCEFCIQDEHSLNLCPFDRRYEYAYLKGVPFHVRYEYVNNDNGNEVDSQFTEVLKLERFDQSEESWVALSQVPLSSEGHRRMIALGDSLCISTTDYEDNDVEYQLRIFRVLKNEDGKISGEWEVVNCNFLFDSVNLEREYFFRPLSHTLLDL